MFQLTDPRKTRVWQEAHEEGIEEGIEKGIEKGIENGKTLAHAEMIRKCLAKGMSVKEIAAFMELSVSQVRRLVRLAKS